MLFVQPVYVISDIIEYRARYFVSRFNPFILDNFLVAGICFLSFLKWIAESKGWIRFLTRKYRIVRHLSLQVIVLEVGMSDYPKLENQKHRSISVVTI